MVRPYAGAAGPGFLLVQDNARPIQFQFLQDGGIDAMYWPVLSADQNPYEHIRDNMSRSIQKCHVAPQTVGGRSLRRPSTTLSGACPGREVIQYTYRHVEATHTTEPHFDLF